MIKQYHLYILLSLLIMAFCASSSAQIFPYGSSSTLNANPGGDQLAGIPDIATNDEKEWMAVWSTRNFNNGASNISIATSTNAGKAWATPSVIFETNGLITPSLVTDQNGNWVMAWRDGLEVFVGVSTNFGSSWTKQNITTTTEGVANVSEPVIATNRNGAWKVIWSIQKANNLEVIVRTSQDNGSSWSAAAILGNYATATTRVYKIPHVVIEHHNSKNIWAASWVLNRLTASNTLDTDQLVVSTSNGGAWSAGTFIHECQHVRNLDLKSNFANRWVLVWGEEDNRQAAFQRKKIYQATSIDNGKTFSVRNTPIAMGDFPKLEFFGERRWGLVSSRTNFSGIDYDIVVSYSSDNGVTWREEKLVNTYGGNDGGTNDYYPALAKNETEGWGIVWVRSYISGGKPKSDIGFQLADSSPPFPVAVTSDLGAVTPVSTKLSFTWAPFIDEESGVNVTRYQFAFGDTSNIQRYHTFRSINVSASNKTFVPSDFPNTDLPADFFLPKKYVFTIRAFNNVGLFRDSSVIVEVRQLKIGEAVPLPDGKTWDDINWAVTSITHSNHVVFNEQSEILLAGDYNLEDITFRIDWRYKDGSRGPDVLYGVSKKLEKEPMNFYTTQRAVGGNLEPTLAPTVNLSSINEVVVHHNSTVPTAAVFVQEQGVEKILQAVRDKVTQEPAYLILEYQDDQGNFLDFEIVRIKEDITDVPNDLIDIGSRLLPYDTLITREEAIYPSTTVRKGRLDNGLVYQHAVEGAAQEGQLWAIKENPNANNVEVFWHRLGTSAIIWPYQFRKYAFPNWPSDPQKYQLLVRDLEADTLGPAVVLPPELNATLMYEENIGRSTLSNNVFNSDVTGFSLLKYETGTDAISGLFWVGFEVVRTITNKNTEFFDLTAQNWKIGDEILDEYHEGPLPGYIHTVKGDKYAPPVYAETGQVFGVNKGDLQVWWTNLSRIQDPEGAAFPDWPAEHRVQWYSKVGNFDNVWGETPDSNKIIIARQNGTGALKPGTYGEDWELYIQNDPSQHGFNPNEEHAKIFPYGSSKAVFPLRNDLNRESTSEPFVLVQYKEQPNRDKWRFRTFEVIKEEAPYFFRNWAHLAYGEQDGLEIDPYEGDAGKLIQAPFPLSVLPYCEENKAISGPFFEDRNQNHWAKAAGNGGEDDTADITLRYFYPIQETFYLEGLPAGTTVGTHVPWLPNAEGIPTDVTYTIHWPDDVPTMKLGQTVLEASFGIPQIDGQCSVDLLYEQSIENGGGNSVLLIDPVQSRSVELGRVPSSIKKETSGLNETFPDLSLALRRRIFYNPTERQLYFQGEKVNRVVGFDYALLNVMSQREKEELLALSSDGAWTTAINALFNLVKEPIVIEDSSTDPYDVLALTSGLAEGLGYVTLAFQNADQCDPSPISLEIIRVVPELETNGLLTITSDCPFDETLTLRHRGDFGGNTDEYEFEWYYIPDENGTLPDTTNFRQRWTKFPSVPSSGIGAVDATIKGPGLLTLSDNWFICRYKTPSNSILPNTWSDWTSPQLAEGWIKRVVGEINPFSQRATGGGIAGAENGFFDYGARDINTIVSMISQAGERWTGNVPLNCNNIDDFGLIEIYETVLGRGIDLSIEALPPVDYEPANNALLLVASRIADLYTLLGNEAYADASDPTIAYGTEDRTYGSEASSIHCFQNQTSSLLEEELALLRGRDERNAPEVSLHPVYNRLYWNFTNGDGEVAYASNYNIQDQLGNVDGTIDEADAKRLYPQGHGDAWGHYLTATKTYYKLLRNPKYTWNPRTEGILLGGVPLTVDYFDERKFATAAAAKARTGSEIVNLTYRAAYVEDPEGQWQGYKDTDAERAWGFDEWADRSGQAAYLDWVVGNSILPAEDNENTGIQKIDRTTVLELREIAGHAAEIQAKLEEANVGLNPLGLATNAIPFDISPAEIDQGKSHFEQIYDRAVVAMNNAITVFNHANNATQLLRRQADDQSTFEMNVDEREIDFRNRLIEIYGYPYADDIGAGKIYPTGYEGPDLKHYNYVDPSDLQLTTPPNLIETTAYFKEFNVDQNGVLTTTVQPAIFHLSNDANQFGEIKPDSYTGNRRAPGEIQLVRSELIQSKGRLDRALAEYDNLIENIESQWQLLQTQFSLNQEEVSILNTQLNQTQSLLNAIADSRKRQLNFRTAGRLAVTVANASAEFLPLAVGLATDPSSVARGGIRLAGTVISEGLTIAADNESIAELDHQNALQIMQAQTNIQLTTNRQEQGIQQGLVQLQQMTRQEVSMRLELYSLLEAIQQTSGRYLSVLARGQRLQEDLNRFKNQTAANVQSRRYKDMAFRIFRNDALQKYRAQFDLAARYVYLAGKAYDYETALLAEDSRAGQAFLTDIVRQRLIGTIQGGIPQTGEGLADPMQRMAQNFSVFKSQLGINNPQRETNRFSLRSELFRIPLGGQGNLQWRDSLRNYIVPDVFDLPEFQRYCRPFAAPQAAEPAIVIPFTTNVNFGLNFFGNDLTGGDNAYDPSNFTTKIRSAGVWFSNYNNLIQSGMSNTPRVYIVPVGTDIQRSPSGLFGDVREFKVLDQVIPAPFNGVSSSELDDPDWIPSIDNLTSSFAQIRRFSSLRAYHDSGNFNPNEVNRDSRLIGRSVWNTRWLLIIPAGTLLADREEGLQRFINGQLFGDQRDGNGVADIKLFFETYAFPGF